MFQIRRYSCYLLWVLAVGLGACDDTVTESDLQKWTNNEVGLRRVRDIVQDSKRPLETRVRALEIMVEKGRGMELRVRPYIDGIDDEAERQLVLRTTVDQLIEHIVERRPSTLNAKDAVLMAARFLAQDQLERARKAIAEWAFADIEWELSADEVRERIQSRLSTGQIVDLGSPGYKTAAILVANAFNVEQMLRFLVDARDPEAAALAVRALRQLHKSEPVTAFQLDALSRARHPDAVQYLDELSRSAELDPEFRAAAYAFSLSLLRDKELPGLEDARKQAVARLLERVAEADPDQRWLYARNAVELSAGTMLADVLKIFPDDGSYAKAEEDPGKAIMDFCFDFVDLPETSASVPTLRETLSTGHRIQRAIAILCAKTAELGGLIPSLREAAEQIGRPSDLSLEDFLGEGITTGTFARNALEGIALTAEARALLAEGKLTKEQFDNRKYLIDVELELHGDAYRQSVDFQYAAWLEMIAEEAKAKEEAAKAKEEAAKAKAPTDGASPEGDKPVGSSPEPEGASKPDGAQGEAPTEGAPKPNEASN